MRIFIYELTCARWGDATNLAVEGWAMLSAILEDFARIKGVEVVTLLHPRFVQRLEGIRVEQNDLEHEEKVFRAIVRDCDSVLVIAPEFQGLLTERCLWVEKENKPLLGPGVQAISLCSDKLLLGQHLGKHGLPTPETREASLGDVEINFPLVLKPRDGAGSQATFVVKNETEFALALDQARMEGWEGPLIVQPFVEGLAASAAFLVGPDKILDLPATTQSLSEDGRCHYLGGKVPLSRELANRATQTGRQAIQSIPGLRGYIGIDVVLGTDLDWIIEINPRLTTSYIGLRALAEENLAEAWLQTIQGEEVILGWKPGAVEFDGTGSWRWEG